jgi:hypothetical protein
LKYSYAFLTYAYIFLPPIFIIKLVKDSVSNIMMVWGRCWRIVHDVWLQLCSEHMHWPLSSSSIKCQMRHQSFSSFQCNFFLKNQLCRLHAMRHHTSSLVLRISGFVFLSIFKE